MMPRTMPEQTNELPEHLQVAAVRTDRTRGERFFDFFTYKIINFGLNELLSLGITDWFLGGTDRKDGKATSYFANKMGDRAVKVSDKLYNFQKGMDAKVGSTAGAVFTLNLGGHITATMVKLLENNRVGLSRQFDNFLDSITGTKKTAEEMQKREVRYEILRNTPVKTSKQVIWGRISGMLASMALNQLPEWVDEKVLKQKPTNDKFFAIRRLTGKAGHYLEKPIVAAMESRGNKLNDMAKKRVSYWSELVLFETWCTWLTSFVMEKVVKWNDHKETPANSTPEPVAQAPVENRGSKDLATAAVSHYYEEQGPDKDKKRWSERKGGYDYEDEVGIQI